MANISRRQLAVYVADQLIQKKSVPAIAKQMASVLIASRRQNQAELLADDTAWELERRGIAANTQVLAANQLSEQLKTQIATQVKKAANVKLVIINEHVDQSVIGGLRIDTAAHSWDNTLSRKLTDIREEI